MLNVTVLMEEQPFTLSFGLQPTGQPQDGPAQMETPQRTSQYGPNEAAHTMMGQNQRILRLKCLPP